MREPKKHKIYVVYDMEDNECAVCIGRLKDVAKFFDTTLSSALNTINRGAKRKGRYFVERIEDEEQEERRT